MVYRELIYLGGKEEGNFMNYWYLKKGDTYFSRGEITVGGCLFFEIIDGRHFERIIPIGELDNFKVKKEVKY